MTTSLSNASLNKTLTFPPGIASEIEGASVVIAGQRFGYEKTEPIEFDKSTLSNSNNNLKLLEQRKELMLRISTVNFHIQNILERKSGGNDLNFLKAERADLQVKIEKLDKELARV